MPDYVGMVQTRVQRKQTDAAIVAAEKATKASQANVTSWEEVQEQPSDDSSIRDESVEQSETSVVEQQVEEPGEWLMRKRRTCQYLLKIYSSLTDQQGRNSPAVSATISDTSHQRDRGVSRYRLLRRVIRHQTPSERVSIMETSSISWRTDSSTV